MVTMVAAAVGAVIGQILRLVTATIIVVATLRVMGVLE